MVESQKNNIALKGNLRRNYACCYLAISTLHRQKTIKALIIFMTG